MIFLFIVGLALCVFAGALVKYAVEKTVSRECPRRCSGGRCGEFGWALMRKDDDSCHAICIKCGWMSHFDTKKWHEVQ